MKNIDISKYTALLNLMSIIEVTDEIIVEDLDAGDTINVSELIREARRELGI